MSKLHIVRYILRLAAIATFLIGVSLLVLPGEIVSLFSGDKRSNEHFAVYLGTALVGFGVANWLFSQMNDLRSILPAIYGNLASLVPATVIDVMSILSGRGEVVVWLVLLLHAVFGAAFLYSLKIIMENIKTNMPNDLDVRVGE